jgi:hypothetical protein
MISVVCGIGFFGVPSFETPLSFSGFVDAFTFSGAGFSPGAGSGFFTGLSGFPAAGGVTTGSEGSGAGETRISGIAPGAAGGASPPISFPQDSQNRASGASAAPHCGQATDASIFAPQDSQNFMPGVTGLLHF